MNMTFDSIEALDKLGAFTPVGLAEESIQWHQDGKDYQAVVYVRPLSFDSAVTDLINRPDQSDNPDAIARRIASSICNKAGEPIFTVGDITGQANPERGALSYALTMALLAAIGRVNKLGKVPSHPATPRKSGSNSSSTGSAGARSRKPKAD